MPKEFTIVKLSGRFVRQDDTRAIARVNQATEAKEKFVKVTKARAEKINALRKTMGLVA